VWLLELTANYYDLATFPDGETKRALQRLLKKQTDKSARSTPSTEKPPKKKVKMS
jgi:pre-mRNA-splicing factor ATP-dependent RNA helicase DHX15/PRP43